MRSAVVMAALALAGCERGPPPEKVVVREIMHESESKYQSLPPDPEQNFQALGTEPFWAVEVRPGRLRYTTPENQKGTEFPARRTIEGEAQVWTGTFEGSQFTLRIAPGICSDGMSDTVYGYTAMVAFAGETRQGCARLR
jgi:uncharacterized membrane protein